MCTRPQDNEAAVSNVNYPLSAPLNLRYLSVIRSNPGSNIQLILSVPKESQNCSDSYVEVSLQFSLNLLYLQDTDLFFCFNDLLWS